MILELLSTPAVTITVLISFLLYRLACTVLQAYKLRSIPGPLYARFSSLVISYHTLRNSRISYIHKLHQQYGNIVVLGPDEIHVNDLSLLNQIYSSFKVGKHPYYSEFAYLGTQNLFSTIDPARHARSRKQFSNLYTRPNLNLPVVYQCIQDFCRTLDDRDTVEMTLGFETFTKSVICRFVFGRHVELGEQGTSNTLRNLRRLCRRTGFDSLATLVACLTPVSKPSPFEDSITSSTRSIIQSQSTKIQNDFLISRMIDSRIYTNAEIVSEARDHLIAGSDTTTTVLSCLFHQLARSPLITERLRRELNQIDVSNYEEVERVTYLNSVIKEALRLYASIPMTLPRVTLQPIVLGDHVIPSNIKIGSQAYSLHRTIDGETFDPDRKEERGWEFSSGSRSCIGKALAICELTWLTAVLVLTFDFETSTTELGVLQDILGFGMSPQDKLMMTFVRRANRSLP